MAKTKQTKSTTNSNITGTPTMQDMTKLTENLVPQTGTGLDYFNTEETASTAVQTAPKCSLRDVLEKEVAFTPYAVDLWYPGCANADEADKMICFMENEEDLDTYLALFMSQNNYTQIVKEAEDIQGALVAPAEFLLTRIYFEPKSPMLADSENINIKAAALWFGFKFGCTDAEEVLRDLIAKSQ